MTQRVDYKRRFGIVILFYNLLDFERRQDSPLNVTGPEIVDLTLEDYDSDS